MTNWNESFLAVRNWGLAQKDVHNQMDIAKLQRQLADQINDYNALVNQYNALLEYTQQLRNTNQQLRDYNQHLSQQLQGEIDRERASRAVIEGENKELNDNIDELVQRYTDPIEGLNTWLHAVLRGWRTRQVDILSSHKGMDALDLPALRKLNINVLAMALVYYEGLIEMPVTLAYAADNPQWLAQNNDRATRLLGYHLPQIGRVVTGDSADACQQRLTQRYEKARIERIEPALEKGDLAFQDDFPKVLLCNEQSDLASFWRHNLGQFRSLLVISITERKPDGTLSYIMAPNKR